MGYLEGLMAADKNFLARKEMGLREEADARAKREFEWRQEEQDRQNRERTAIEQQRSLGLSPFISRGDAGFDPFNFGQGAQPAVQAPLPEVPPAAQTLSPPVRSPIGSAPQTGDDRLFILNNELRLAQASGNQADVAGLTREIERVTSGGKTTEPSVKKGTTWRSSPEESNKGIVLPDYYNRLLAQRDAAANDPAAVARIEADLRDVAMEMRRAKVNLPSPLPTMAARPQGGLMPPQAQAPMPEMVAATGLQPQQTAVQTPAVQMQPQATQAPQAAPQDITSTAEWKALESAYALAKTPEQLLMVQNAAIALVNRQEYAGLASKVMQATPEQLKAFAQNFTDATHIKGSAKTNADGTMTISLDGGKPATYRRDQLAVIVVGLSKLRKGDPSGVSDIASVNKDLAESVQRDLKNNIDVATVNTTAAQTSGQISDGRSRAEVQTAHREYYTELTSALSEARDYRKQASEKVQQFTELSIADQNGPVGKALMNQIQMLNMKAGGGMPGLGRQSSDQPKKVPEAGEVHMVGETPMRTDGLGGFVAMNGVMPGEFTTKMKAAGVPDNVLANMRLVKNGTEILVGDVAFDVNKEIREAVEYARGRDNMNQAIAEANKARMNPGSGGYPNYGNEQLRGLIPRPIGRPFAQPLPGDRSPYAQR